MLKFKHHRTLLFITIIFLYFSCAEKAGFNTIIASMDQMKADSISKDRFYAAASKADNSEDWIILLKRIWEKTKLSGFNKDELDVFSDLSIMAIEKHPESITLAMIAERAFIETSNFKKSEELFSTILSKNNYPGLFTEYIINHVQSVPAEKMSLRSEDFSVLFNHTKNPVFLINASLVSMLTGDKQTARMFALYAEQNGLNPDMEIAWDLDLFNLILDYPVPDTEIAQLRKADALLLSGDTEYAEIQYRRIIENGFISSWKPYATLAKLVSDNTETDNLIKRMQILFPDNKYALRTAISIYVSKNMIQEAKKLSVSLDKNIPEEAILELGLLDCFGIREQVISMAFKVAERFPENGDVLDQVYYILEKYGYYQEVSSLMKAGYKTGATIENCHFHEAVSRIVKSDLNGAKEIFEQGVADTGDFALAYNLGIINQKSGFMKEASEVFKIAESYAKNSREKAIALIAFGKNEKMCGNDYSSRKAFEAAYQSDPDYSEARLLYKSSYK